MRLLRLRRKKPRLRELSEAEAYANSYGERTLDVRPVQLEPRRPRFKLHVSGEELRRRFEERLNARDAHDS